MIKPFKTLKKWCKFIKRKNKVELLLYFSAAELGVGAHKEITPKTPNQNCEKNE